MNTNALLGLAVLGVGGFVLWKMAKGKAASEEAEIMSSGLPTPEDPEEVAAKYGGAISNWAERFVGEEMPNGDMLFEPLDISAQNPLRMYYAVVKKRTWKPSPGAVLGLKPIFPLVGEIFLFNTVTNREVRLDELAQQTTMTVDAKKATEETFANAFVYSCKIDPRYLHWTNRINTGITSNNIEYWRRQCQDTYEAGL